MYQIVSLIFCPYQVSIRQNTISPSKVWIFAYDVEQTEDLMLILILTWGRTEENKHHVIHKRYFQNSNDLFGYRNYWTYSLNSKKGIFFTKIYTYLSHFCEWWRSWGSKWLVT